MQIFEIKLFVNNEDLEVKEYMFEGKHSHYTADVLIPLGNGQGFPLHVDFPKSYTLEECYDNFHNAVKEELDELKKKAEEKQRADKIIPATSMPDTKGFKLV
jgi:hypothetical protein